METIQFLRQSAILRTKKNQGKMVNIDVRVDVRPERKVNCCEASDCGTSELKIKLV